jgi:hypothetical protein
MQRGNAIIVANLFNDKGTTMLNSDYLGKRIIYKIKPDIEVYEGMVLEISPNGSYLCIGKINSLIFEWYAFERLIVCEILPDKIPLVKIREKKKNEGI